MNSIVLFVKAHPTTTALAAYYVLSAAIGSLPMPDADSHKFYRWFFKFANAIAANVARMAAAKLPAITEPQPTAPAQGKGENKP